MTTTVLLVDDHEMIRHGLRRAFERRGEFSVVGETSTVQEALAAFDETDPQVVVTNLTMPGGTGFDLIRAIRDGGSNAGIVVFTMHAGDAQLFRAMELGTSAFVSKESPAEEVVAAARHAAVSPHAFMAKDLRGAMQRRLARTNLELSPRERDVLRLLVDWVLPRLLSGCLSASPRRRPSFPSCTRSSGARTRRPGRIQRR